MEEVFSSLNKMRQDFIGYINESNIQAKLDEITNIIQPEKFIQKHLGDLKSPEEINQKLMFENVIVSPPRSSSRRVEEESEGDEEEEIKVQEYSEIQKKVNNGSSAKEMYKEAKKKSTVDLIKEKMKHPIVEEE